MENLSRLIEARLHELGLSMDQLRGQCYDGAGLYKTIIILYKI